MIGGPTHIRKPIRSSGVYHARPCPVDSSCARRGVRPIDRRRRHDLALTAHARSERRRACLTRRLACTVAPLLPIHPPRPVLAQHDARARQPDPYGGAETGLVDPRCGFTVPKESVDANRRVGGGLGERFGATRTRRAWMVVQAVSRSLFGTEQARGRCLANAGKRRRDNLNPCWKPLLYENIGTTSRPFF